MTRDVLVDPDALREQVRGKYREVAVDPGGSFHFHTGRSLAARLGYEAAAAAALPDRAVESFAGVGNPSMFLLFAGHETTVVAIGMGALMLLTQARQWHILRDDPGLIPAAAEEMLRAPGTGGDGIPRYARADLQISGAQVRAGDLVLLDNGAANHDASAFPDPDRFDITRQGAAHLTFGHGPRYCIGARHWPASSCRRSSPSSSRCFPQCAWPCPSNSSPWTPARSPAA